MAKALALALLMLRILFADHNDASFSAYDLAVSTHDLYGRSDLHKNREVMWTELR